MVNKAKSLIIAENIQDKIFTLRGLQVMLDRDLAILYEVKAIRLREQVKRNKKRFPSDFMFRLTKEETNSMVSQNAIPSKSHLGKKWFAFSRMDSVVKDILSRVKKSVKNKVLNQAVKRNIKRFSERFMFQLSEGEEKLLRSQFVTLKLVQGEYRKYLPYAFTEQGVSMLSAILKSPTVIEIS